MFSFLAVAQDLGGQMYRSRVTSSRESGPLSYLTEDRPMEAHRHLYDWK